LQNCVTIDKVEGIPEVQLHNHLVDGSSVSSQPRPDSVYCSLGSGWDSHTKLGRPEVVSGFCTNHLHQALPCKPAENFPDGNGPDTSTWLG
jgi:hypothetical protein